ncbi:MAG: hypothetical protein K9M44_04275 [Candidatus Pacebacteria bacterium]|nr:hypothetical protein [Candidatus Paceibacterota bacterium]
MDINLNLIPIQNFLALAPDEMFWTFFFYFGWMILVAMFLAGVIQIWLIRKQTIYGSKVKYIFLAIDIPRGNEQTPKAVENIFTYFSGAHGSINFIDKWFEGKFQLSISLEIVSIEGYTQFIIRTPERFRNLVESAIYSHYPDAEISQIDDYTTDIPTKYPNDEYDVWGSEFIHANNDMLPIKTYPDFEHQMGPSETQFKDPMASLMDLCSSLGPGEQLWHQIILVPIGFDWMGKGDEVVDDILQKKKAHKKGLDTRLIEWLGELSEVFFSIWQDVERKEEREEDTSLSMMELTPKQKKQVEGVHRKTSKLAFETKIRTVYVFKKESANTSKVANGFIGYMKQFAALDLNNLKPDANYTMTKAEYFNQGKRIIRKKNNIINNYISRGATEGRNPGILNIEELATLWHFPVEDSVQSPLLQKAPGRKAEAPSSLPLSSITEEEQENDFFKQEVENRDESDLKEEKASSSDSDFGGYADLNGGSADQDMEEFEQENEEDIYSNDEDNIFKSKVEKSASNSDTDNKQANSNKEESKAEKAGAPPSNLPFA